MPIETKEIRYTTASELRLAGVADDELPKLVGYAAVFGKLSQDVGGFREIIQQGAFTETLGRHDDVRALVEHDGGLMTLGRTTAGTLRLTEDDVGLRVEIDPPDTQAGRDIIELVGRGDIGQMSFGFHTVADSWNMVDGEEVRTLIEVELFDVSIVSFPAYPGTKIGLRSLEAQQELIRSHDREILDVYQRQQKVLDRQLGKV